MISAWRSIYSGGQGRGAKIARNILWSMGLKAVNLAVSFVVVPLYLSLLTETSFGVWLTVSAVVQWLNFFDLGLGNGLRNKLSEALAANDTSLARVYVSTTYALLTLIAAGVLALFSLSFIWVDWSDVFAAPDGMAREVNRMVLVLGLLFVPQFIFQPIKMVVTADQRPALANAMNTVVNVLQLAGISVLVWLEVASLVVLALLMGSANLLVPIVAHIVLFAGRYRDFAPRRESVDFAHSKALLGLGTVFLILQLAALVVFMTDNLIISRVLGPDEVPAYNIAYRYFNIGTVLFAMVTTPFWSAFTEAYVKKDFGWIRRMLRRLIRIWLLMSAGVVVMFFLSPWVYDVWIGDTVDIPKTLSLCMGLWVVVSSGLSIYGTFLSGVGKLRVSLYHAVFVMIVNIPLSIYLAGFPALGSAGVILATILGASFRVFFQPYQTYRLIAGTARGIWNR